ncbi:MAG: putative DNA-binding domain-containing protein [Rhodospirillales bacterium]|nr:putative DNA-binding domain-containing protein [Alphaproteobacteria bacterium]MBL6948533.1 putative DNA-binding domain-containing protein [Rhodospirillales bacterium]
MSTLHEFQTGFVKALWSADEVLPEEGFAMGGIPVAAGLAVYRNNVFAGLAGVLGDLYPVVKMLVGDAFFAHAAQEFVKSHPPASPVLAEYGGDFPDFLAAFEAAESVPYLSGVAELELARHQALSAPEAEPLAASALKAVPEEHLAVLCFEFHPSVRLVASVFPVDAIWAAHQKNCEKDQVFDVSAFDIPDRAARLLVARPGESIETMELSHEAFDFVSRLIVGEPLGRAFTAAGDGWDPQQTLADLLVFGAFTGFQLTEG